MIRVVGGIEPLGYYISTDLKKLHINFLILFIDSGRIFKPTSICINFNINILLKIEALGEGDEYVKYKCY